MSRAVVYDMEGISESDAINYLVKNKFQKKEWLKK